MTDRPDQPERPDDDPSDGAALSEADLGEPVTELSDLGWRASDDFGVKVTRRIERRLLTGRLLDVAWTAPMMVLLELIRVPFDAFSGNRRS